MGNLPPENWTVSRVLEMQSERYLDKPMIILGDDTLSYSAALGCAKKCAGLFQRTGIRTGDRVGVMLPNCMEYCLTWFGLSWAGAVHVAVNTDYKGRFLTHVLNNCACESLVVHRDYLAELDAISDSLNHLKTVYVVGEGAIKCAFKNLSFSRWKLESEVARSPVDSYQRIGCVMYTSGTTGPSKGVLMPHAHLYLFGLGTLENMKLNEDDVFYIVLPLFHANGMFMQLYASMIAGATAVIRQKFSASAWIADVVRCRATVTNSLGVIGTFILNQPGSEMDRQHCLRNMGMAPNSEALENSLKQRFNIPNIIGMYGMTEVNIPLYTVPGISKPDSCGKVWSKYFEVKIVDPESDEDIKSGNVGEIVVRPKLPFGFMSGYLNMPEKTLEAWRNFWFHTGDAAWMDDGGYVYFVDRIKDCIRRRGENISSCEVENCLLQFPDVAEVAAYAVESDISGGEDEIMVAVVAVKDSTIEFEELATFVRGGMPDFTIPRYFRNLSELPKTPTGKVQKHVLRKEGVTIDAWDRSSGQKS